MSVSPIILPHGHSSISCCTRWCLHLLPGYVGHAVDLLADVILALALAPP